MPAVRASCGGGRGVVTGTDAAALAAELRTVVLERGYVRRATPFQLSSGALSHDYVDMRRALARGADLAVAARALLAHLEQRKVHYVALGGMTMGADPVAHAAAVLGGRSWFSVRKADKTHGTGRRIEGAEISAGTPVVLVEDTVSTGASMLEALCVLQAAGATVVRACALVDRGDVAGPALRAAGVSYDALLTYADIGIEPLGVKPATTG